MTTNLIEPPGDRPSDGSPVSRVVDELEKELVQVFKLLSDETRLRILVYLAREAELHVTALCDRLGQSQPAVSHHLALLRVAGLIKARRDGKHNYYSVRQSRFRRLMEQLFHSIGEAGQRPVPVRRVYRDSRTVNSARARRPPDFCLRADRPLNFAAGTRRAVTFQ